MIHLSLGAAALLKFVTREKQLDVVRGLAILLALGWHFNEYTGNTVFDLLMFPGREIGWAGVDLFFVLSGFLIGRMILTELIETGRFQYKIFLIRRAFRLWPVLYLYIVAQLFLGDKPWNSYLFQVLFHVQNYFPTPLAGLWSLAVEEHFYLLAGVALPLLARRRSKPEVYVIVLIYLMVGVLVARCLGEAAGVSAYDLQSLTHFRADALACGMLIAVIAVHYPFEYRRIRSHRLLWFFVAVAGFALLVFTGRSAFGYTIAYLASASLILALDQLRLLSWAAPLSGITAFLGLYSYSIYIWHFPIGNAVARKFAEYIVLPAEVLVCVKYFSASVAGIIIAKVVERPFISLRDTLFPRWHAGAGQSPLVDNQEGARRAG